MGSCYLMMDKKKYHPDSPSRKNWLSHWQQPGPARSFFTLCCSRAVSLQGILRNCEGCREGRDMQTSLLGPYCGTAPWDLFRLCQAYSPGNICFCPALPLALFLHVFFFFDLNILPLIFVLSVCLQKIQCQRTKWQFSLKTTYQLDFSL